jgi:hypothetical protein
LVVLWASCLLVRHSTIWWYWGFELGLELSRQTLYHLRHTASPFCCSYFWDRVLHLCPGWPGLWYSYSCYLYGWDDRCTPLHPSHQLRWGLSNFLPKLALNHDPSNCCLLSS